MQYGFCLREILSRNAILQTGHGNGLPAKSVVSITLCSRPPFRALAAGPIGPKQKRIRAVITGLAVQFHLYYLWAAKKRYSMHSRPAHAVPAEKMSPLLLANLGPAMTLPICFKG